MVTTEQKSVAEVLDGEFKNWSEEKLCVNCKRNEHSKSSYSLMERKICDDCDLFFKRRDRWINLCPVIYGQTTRESLISIAKISDGTVDKAVSVLAEQEKGLLLHGTTGRGKTRLMYYAIKEWFKHCDNVEYALMYGWERDKRRYIFEPAGMFGIRYGEALGTGKGTALLDEYFHATILFIDDLGNQKITERTAEGLFLIVEERMSNNLPVYFTTNHVGAKLAERFDGDMGAAFVRRVRESCEFLTW